MTKVKGATGREIGGGGKVARGHNKCQACREVFPNLEQRSQPLSLTTSLTLFIFLQHCYYLACSLFIICLHISRLNVSSMKVGVWLLWK